MYNILSYIDLFKYMTYKNGFNNLPQVWSAAGIFDWLVLDFYPESYYVGIIGLSVYTNDELSQYTSCDYQDLKNLVKSTNLAKFGPTISTTSGNDEYLCFLTNMTQY